jgi:hypothetical protein
MCDYFHEKYQEYASPSIADSREVESEQPTSVDAWIGNNEL